MCTGMPRRKNSSTGAQPTALPMLDSGLSTIWVPVCLMMSISAGVTWMQWPSMVRGPSRSCCSRRSIGEMPPRFRRESHTSFMPSHTWIWKPVRPSLASAILSMVSSDSVKVACPPNMAAIMESPSAWALAAHCANSAFSAMDWSRFASPRRSEVS